VKRERLQVLECAVKTVAPSLHFSLADLGGEIDDGATSRFSFRLTVGETSELSETRSPLAEIAERLCSQGVELDAPPLP
jgi:hypothetical protein